MPLDPEFRRRITPFRDVDLGRLFGDPELRAAYDAAFADPGGYEPPAVDIDDHSIDGPAGPFRVRVYRPRDGFRRGVGVVWVHGGGFVGGSIEMREADVVSRELAVRASATVVSVDYHLAGADFRYPTLHREVLAAVRWTRRHADDLGVDASRLGLAGASAGANLALAATLELRDVGEELPERLALAYPALHRTLRPLTDVDGDLDVLPRTLRFDQGTMDFIFGAYIGDNADAPLASVEGADLSGLPPCLVVVNEYDDLRPSGEDFATAASAAGVAVDVHVAEGMPHGHLNMTPNVPETAATLDRLATFFRQTKTGV